MLLPSGTLPPKSVENLAVYFPSKRVLKGEARFDSSETAPSSSRAKLHAKNASPFKHSKSNNNSVTSLKNLTINESNLLSSASSVSLTAEDGCLQLQNFFTATIPTFDLMTIAHGHSCIVMDVGDSKDACVSSVRCISDLPMEVTAIACYPVPSSRLADPHPYEWTVIILGFMDGSLMLYTDRGFFLYKLQYSDKSVLQISVEADEILILYENCYVVINSLTLLTAVKYYRQKIARGYAQASSLSLVASPEIIWHKFSLENVKNICQITSTGTYQQSLWEQLVAASTRGGYHAYVGSSGRKPYDTYCALGAAPMDEGQSSPFVSFHWHQETSTLTGSELIRQAVYEVADRLLSSAGFKLPWSKSSKPVEEPNDQELEKLRQSAIASKPVEVFQRSLLGDLGRYGMNIVVSPGHSRFALICDSCARVLLVDLRKRLIVRMWKGYRDAQCAWLEVKPPKSEKYQITEDEFTGVVQESEKGSILCVVIYAPKRGILEVWSAQNGRRVSACNVSKEGVLFYCPLKGSSGGKNPVDETKTPVRFMDSDLNLFTLNIPYQVAAEKCSTNTYWTAEARLDFETWWTASLAKELREPVVDETQQISRDETSSNEIHPQLRLCNRFVIAMKNADDFHYLIDKVMISNVLDYKTACLFIDSILLRMQDKLLCDKNKSTPECLLQSSPENQELRYRCRIFRQLIDSYAFILNYDPKVTSSDLKDKNPDSKLDVIDTLAKDFHMNVESLSLICTNLDINSSIREAQEKQSQQSTSAQISLSDYISYFETSRKVAPFALEAQQENAIVELKEDLPSQDVAKLGHFIFTPFLIATSTEQLARTILPSLSITVSDYLHILCTFWFEVKRHYSVFPKRFLDLINFILKYGVKEQIEVEDETADDASDAYYGSCLEACKTRLMDTDKVAEALCLCLVLRAVAKRLGKSKASISIQKTSESDENSWEHIDLGVESWDSLLKMLHARLVFDSFLRQFVSQNLDSKNKISEFKFRPLENINGILILGPGFAAEEAARYIANECYIPEPKVLIEAFRQVKASIDKKSEKYLEEASSFANQPSKDTNSMTINLPSTLNDLCRQFFYADSLEATTLAANLCWEHARRFHADAKQNADSLIAAVHYAQLIDSAKIRRGLCALIWHKFLRDRVSALCKTLEKLPRRSKSDPRRLASRANLDAARLGEFARLTSRFCCLARRHLTDDDAPRLLRPRHRFHSDEDEDLLSSEDPITSLIALNRRRRQDEERLRLKREQRRRQKELAAGGGQRRRPRRSSEEISDEDSSDEFSDDENEQSDELKRQRRRRRRRFKVETFVVDFFHDFSSNARWREPLTDVANSQPYYDGMCVQLCHELCIVLSFIFDELSDLSNISFSPFEFYSHKSSGDRFFADWTSTYSKLGSNSRELAALFIETFDTSTNDDRLRGKRAQFIRRCLNRLLYERHSIGEYAISERRTDLLLLCDEDCWQMNLGRLVYQYEALSLFAQGRADDASYVVDKVANKQELAQDVFDSCCIFVGEHFNRTTHLKPLIPDRLMAIIEKTVNRATRNDSRSRKRLSSHRDYGDDYHNGGGYNNDDDDDDEESTPKFASLSACSTALHKASNNFVDSNSDLRQHIKHLLTFIDYWIEKHPSDC